MKTLIAMGCSSPFWEGWILRLPKMHKKVVRAGKKNPKIELIKKQN